MTCVNFKLETDADGIALITWDAPGRPHVIDRNGVRRTLLRAGELAGVRFVPSKLLIDMVQKGDTFYGRFAGQRAAA